MFRQPFALQEGEPLSPHLIAVDTEYHTAWNDDIDKVFCAVFVTKDGEPLKIWFNEQKQPTVLQDVAKHFGIEHPIFVCHAFCKAEFRAFRFLGSEPEAYRWFDTHLAFRLNRKEFGFKEDDDGEVRASYAVMCKELLGIYIDCERKTAMRELCINDTTQGHEDEIMAYCYDDTRHLIPCVHALFVEYKNIITKALQIKVRTRFETPLPFRELWMRLQDANRAFACIAARGLPVSVARCDAVRRGAVIMHDRETRRFVEKYPGAYESAVNRTLSEFASTDVLVHFKAQPSLQDAISMFKSKLDGFTDKKADILNNRLEKFYIDGDVWKRNDKKCQDYMRDCLQNLGMLDKWPRTPTGALSMKAEDLKIFKVSDGVYCMENFAADYAKLSDVLSTLKGVSKDWLDTLDRDTALLRYGDMRPFRSVTGRCQPSPKAGFVPLWSHSLYCVLEPPEGKWLVELDYSSEETFIQSQVYQDPAYNAAYHSKDMYLWMGVQLGVIPREDYDALTVDELKKKFKDIRKRLKTFTLAQSYGSGVQTLSMKSGIPVEQVKQLKWNIDNKIFTISTEYKKRLGNLLRYGRNYSGDMYSAILLESGYFAKLSVHGKALSMMNYPIQGTGGQILQTLVIELELLGIETVCSVHDAVMFMVQEGDYDTIQTVRDTMKRVADYTLGVKEGEEGMKVGEPLIVKHGEMWHEDDADYEAGCETLRAGGYPC